MKWLAKPILWLMTAGIPVFIAACYGTGYMGRGDWDEGEDSGTKFIKGKLVNANREGIPGIQVSCLKGDAGDSTSEAFTLEGDGAFSLELPPDGCGTILAEDVDGAENGSYESKQVTVDDTEDITIELSEAE